MSPAGRPEPERHADGYRELPRRTRPRPRLLLFAALALLGLAVAGVRLTTRGPAGVSAGAAAEGRVALDESSTPLQIMFADFPGEMEPRVELVIDGRSSEETATLMPPGAFGEKDHASYVLVVAVPGARAAHEATATLTLRSRYGGGARVRTHRRYDPAAGKWEIIYDEWSLDDRPFVSLDEFMRQVAALGAPPPSETPPPPPPAPPSAWR